MGRLEEQQKWEGRWASMLRGWAELRTDVRATTIGQSVNPLRWLRLGFTLAVLVLGTILIYGPVLEYRTGAK